MVPYGSFTTLIKEFEETLLFCLRVMVGFIILFNHIHLVGAFAKKAAIDVRKKECVEGVCYTLI